MESRVSNSQVEELLEFMATHRILAQGFGLGARSKDNQKTLWDDLASRLNAHGIGATKSGERWKRYWINLKHKAKARSSESRRDMHGTGGGPPNHDTLSETDRKILDIIGPRAVHGDVEYLVPVFGSHNSQSTPGSSQWRDQPSMLSQANELSTRALSPAVITVSDTAPSIQESHTFIEALVAEEGRDEPENTTLVHERDELPAVEPPGSQKKPAKNKGKVEPEWIVELERRRVAAEEKLADAAHLMAQASVKNAETAQLIGQSIQAFADTVRLLVENLVSHSQRT